MSVSCAFLCFCFHACTRVYLCVRVCEIVQMCICVYGVVFVSMLMCMCILHVCILTVGLGGAIWSQVHDRSYHLGQLRGKCSELQRETTNLEEELQQLAKDQQLYHQKQKKLRSGPSCAARVLDFRTACIRLRLFAACFFFF